MHFHTPTSPHEPSTSVGSLDPTFPSSWSQLPSWSSMTLPRYHPCCNSWSSRPPKHIEKFAQVSRLGSPYCLKPKPITHLRQQEPSPFSKQLSWLLVAQGTKSMILPTSKLIRYQMSNMSQSSWLHFKFTQNAWMTQPSWETLIMFVTEVSSMKGTQTGSSKICDQLSQ